MVSSVLIVDDEKDIVDTLEFNLKQAGFHVLAALDGTTAVDLATRHRPDVVLLDMMLPDLSGDEVLRILRAQPTTRRAGVIIVSARDDEVDRVVGFELGADDYVTKPFSVRELIARIKALLRRAGEERRAARAATDGSGLMSHGPFAIDEDRHAVMVAGRPIALTLTEFRLLATLVRARGRVATREVLLQEVWGYDAEVISRTVDTHIRRLREKLGAASGWVKTVRGIGYRLEDPVEA